MKVVCPYCNIVIEVAESSVSRHNLLCQSCGKYFFAAGDLTFRYGIMLDSSVSGSARVACPYCHQHYGVNYIPFHNMIGCVECLKIFVLPRNEDLKNVRPSDKTIAISPHILKKPSPQGMEGKQLPLSVQWRIQPSKPGSIQVFPWAETTVDNPSPVLIKPPDKKNWN